MSMKIFIRVGLGCYSRQVYQGEVKVLFINFGRRVTGKVYIQVKYVEASTVGEKCVCRGRAVLGESPWESVPITR